MTERDVTISGRTASTIELEYVTNYSQISMQLAQQSPEVVNLVTQEVSESINRKIESELEPIRLAGHPWIPSRKRLEARRSWPRLIPAP